MSSPSDTFDSYIEKTLHSEQQAEARAVREELFEQSEYERALRNRLQDALERDDKKAALRAVYELLQDSDDYELESLYDFLLSRIGVPRREPLLTASVQPVVQWLSAVIVSVPVLFLLSYMLSPREYSETNRFDALSCLGAILVFGVPLWDTLAASVYNRLNQYRLID